MKKIVAAALAVLVLGVFASVALAERGDIGGVGVTGYGTVKPNERCDIGGVGCAVSK